jgi:hypothetical protein
VDNASGDNSVPLFREASALDTWGEEVELIEAARNGGFGYWFDSRYRCFRKHHGAIYATACELARAAGLLLWYGKERALGRPGKTRPKMLRDLLAASWKNLRQAALGT